MEFQNDLSSISALGIRYTHTRALLTYLRNATRARVCSALGGDERDTSIEAMLPSNAAFKESSAGRSPGSP